MTTKWFFQRDLCKYPLVQLQAAAADMGHPRIGPLSQSQMITINFLNAQFYPEPNWAVAQTGPWLPVKTMSIPLTIKYKDARGNPVETKIGENWDSHTQKGYYESINWKGGWFDPRLLNAFEIHGRTGQAQGALPVAVGRYNPNEDTGEGNSVYLIALTKPDYKEPTTTPNYIIRGLPLWMAFYGFRNFIQYTSRDKSIMKSHMFIVKCPAIKRLSTTSEQTYYPLLDSEFIAGKLPFDEYLDDNQKKILVSNSRQTNNHNKCTSRIRSICSKTFKP